MVPCRLIWFVAVLLRALLGGFRSRRALLTENTLLRHQLAVLKRSVPKPKLTPLDRIALVALALITPAWKTAVHLVRPSTVLRWHRAGFRALWRWKTRAGQPPRRLDPETITLIRTMANENRLWGAERIRGELLKLGLRGQQANGA